MAKTNPLTPSEKLGIALELFESGVAMMRETLKREHPTESEAQIEERLRQWIRHRPGAEDGDCVGRKIDPSSRFP
ncbi:MAG TPA: hypothetical protein VIE88_16780 [Vicinamibacteria bacterium]